MSEFTVLQRLQHSLVLQDVYIRHADAKIIGTFDPKTSDASDFNIQLRVAVESAEHHSDRQDLVRYTIGTGLRFIHKSADESADQAVVAEIVAAFIVEYKARDASAVNKDALKVFEENAIHHAWPYWREFIHTSSGRLRLPAVILPMRQPLKKPPAESATLPSPQADPAIATAPSKTGEPRNS